MPRYVVLEHDFPERHWDFMLESGGVLRTWKLAAPPEPGRPVRAEASFDHRRLYLDYEGPISGGRGCVIRWDNGSLDGMVEAPDAVTVHLNGQRLQGLAVLTRTADGQWSLVIHPIHENVGRQTSIEP